MPTKQEFQQTADTIQKLIDDLEKRIPDSGSIEPALRAQLKNQQVSLAYVKKKGGLV